MAGKKIITVFGATGSQGGSVVNVFLHDPKLKGEWSVRAVTRDTTKESAKKLESQGAEVVSADMNDTESLAKAMSGAYAVYAVTNYWEKMDMQVEIKQGQNLVDAAKEAGVQLFIWSSLYNVTKLSKGKLSAVYHFDSKAEVEEYARKAGIPAAFFMPGFYMANIPGGNLRPSPPHNAWTLSLPIPDTSPIPVFNTAGDTGKIIKAMVLNRDRVLGQRVLGATTYMTPAEILAAFKKAYPEAGRDATFYELSHDAFRGALKGMGMPDFAAEELLENMRLMNEFGYYGGESLDASHALLDDGDRLTTWEEFMAEAPAFKELK